jgi:acetyl-CoA carboxylase carboxyltransferase component
MVGIIANNGALFSESSLKGAHFVELCNFRKIPMVFLQNIAGFIVGKQYEHGGIARDGAKFVHAVANTVVPKFTIIFGGSFGAGNYAMSGRAFDPDFLFMWPNARISVMGGEQAASVLVQVKQDQLKTEGKFMPEDDMQKMRDSILAKYENESSAYYSSSHLWDDGIIDPIDTRRILAMCIEVSLNRKFEEPRSGVYRM